MSNNTTLQSGTLATPPAGTVIETEDQGGGIHRQVVKVGNNSEKWKAATAWAAAFSTEVNSVASGSSVLSSVAIDNSTALDQYMDVSLSLGSFTSGSGSPYIGLYLYPLNQDGSTYGDGRFSAAAAAQPPSSYFVGAIPVVASVTQAQTGAVTGIVIPPGQFKLVMYNLAGGTLASGSNTIKYRTYNTALQ